MRTRRAALAVTVALALLAGCGGSSSDDTSASEATNTNAASATVTTQLASSSTTPATPTTARVSTTTATAPAPTAVPTTARASETPTTAARQFGGGCSLITAAEVSTIFGRAYVSDPVEGADEDGRMEVDGQKITACSFEPTDSFIFGVLITVFDNSAGLFDEAVEAENVGEDATLKQLSGVGSRATLLTDKLDTTIVAAARDNRLVVASIDALENPVEEQLRRLVLAIID